MKVKLTVTAGPHQGKEFTFDGHETFLVGRVRNAHLQLSYDDPYFSRRQFVIEVNPPRCRVMDLKSRNGTRVNGQRITVQEIQDGDEISAGHTTFKVSVLPKSPSSQGTRDLPLLPGITESTIAQQLSQLDLPDFEVGEELGRGGMGVVYRGTRKSDRMEVAIKMITVADGATRRQVDRFVRECKILSKLSHPNIVGFHQVCETQGAIFLVMELVIGPDAGRILAERGPLEIRVAVRLICQMLNGLAHAHDKGFVHRDLKPANILVARLAGRKRVSKLADFGLARVYESSKLSGLTMQGEVGGTPAYMAPEQVTHYREVRPAADQYAAAASLYKLLTDRYVHDLPAGVAQQLIHLTTEDPVPIQERRAEIPGGLAAIIHKALQREPEERFPSIVAFRDALLAYA